MAVYEREAFVRAPLDDVWEFHSTVDCLRAVTPRWLGLEVHRVTGPDGERDRAVLVPGTTVRLSVRPFGVAPRQYWVSQITAREREDGSAYFADAMRQGPFPTWEHTHSFTAADGGTRVHDRVVFESPLGRSADRVVRLFMEPLFAYRHRRTRALLE